MSVLAKCLSRYCIPWHPKVGYACTPAGWAERVTPNLPNHRLNTL